MPDIDRHGAERIVDALLTDLDDRRGLKTAWRQVSPDVQNELRETWTRIVQGEKPTGRLHPEDALAVALFHYGAQILLARDRGQADHSLHGAAKEVARALTNLLSQYR